MKSEKNIRVSDLDEETRNAILAVATASLMTWDSMTEEDREIYANVAEFTGIMLLESAQELLSEKE